MSSIDHQAKIITVVAAIIRNEHGHLLLVRKRGTAFFMQVGGKLEQGEYPEQSLLREIQEEISVEATIEHYVGEIHTQAANEAGFALRAYLYEVAITGQVQAAAEIEELIWLDPTQPQAVALAPLTQDVVLPYIRQA